MPRGRSSTSPAPSLRPRRPADVPVLIEVLLDQQAASRYPPAQPVALPGRALPARGGRRRAGTAELDGRVGHACRVATLFVGAEGRGLGIGRTQLATVGEDVRTAGLRLCVEDVRVMVPPGDAPAGPPGREAVSRARLG